MLGTCSSHSEATAHPHSPIIRHPHCAHSLVQHEHSNKKLYHTPAITNKSIAYLYTRQVQPLKINGHTRVLSGNFSIRFWRQYVPLFASIAAIISLLLTSNRKGLGLDTQKCNIFPNKMLLSHWLRAGRYLAALLLASDVWHCAKK